MRNPTQRVTRAPDEALKLRGSNTSFCTTYKIIAITKIAIKQETTRDITEERYTWNCDSGNTHTPRENSHVHSEIYIKTSNMAHKASNKFIKSTHSKCMIHHSGFGGKNKHKQISRSVEPMDTHHSLSTGQTQFTLTVRWAEKANSQLYTKKIMAAPHTLRSAASLWCARTAEQGWWSISVWKKTACNQGQGCLCMAHMAMENVHF